MAALCIVAPSHSRWQRRWPSALRLGARHASYRQAVHCCPVRRYQHRSTSRELTQAPPFPIHPHSEEESFIKQFLAEAEGDKNAHRMV